MLKVLDNLRLSVSASTDAETKSRLGQFLTPSSIASFMASLFVDIGSKPVRILDAGAGVGALTTALLHELRNRRIPPADMRVTAYEIDERLRSHLKEVLTAYGTTFDKLWFEVLDTDFIEDAAMSAQFGRSGNYTHAILNPPYKKINSKSEHRFLLRTAGIETVNLYTAFVALAVKLLQSGGQLVAIIPRSFCNGPYYRPFRELILRECAIRQIHLFEARDKAFSDDQVLQENVIVHLEKGAPQGTVAISTSTDDRFHDLEIKEFAFEQIVFPNDREKFFHVPTSEESTLLEYADRIIYSLAQLGIEVSTGPVVDFRLREHTCEMPEPDTVPLLYPGHFVSNEIEWPKPGFKKPNAIRLNRETERWLYPVGFYTVVRRFSSKEERRRLNAGVVNPIHFHQFDMLGFENHLNVFHFRRKGLDEAIAYGLAAYLNTTAADTFFRRFNGHTQVNATDLRMMRYPHPDVLIELGKWARTLPNYNQETLDCKLASIA